MRRKVDLIGIGAGYENHIFGCARSFFTRERTSRRRFDQHRLLFRAEQRLERGLRHLLLDGRWRNSAEYFGWRLPQQWFACVNRRTEPRAIREWGRRNSMVDQFHRNQHDRSAFPQYNNVPYQWNR